MVDPAICHGKPTFRGTRILVADVLEQVANDMAWEAVIEEWRGALTKEAIAEAVRSPIGERRKHAKRQVKWLRGGGVT